MDWVDDGLLEVDSGESKYWYGAYKKKDGVLLDPEHIWTPKLDFVNAIADREGEKMTLDVVKLRNRPLIQQYVEFHADLRSPFDLRHFPFDSQQFEIVFTSSFWSAKDIRFVFAAPMTERSGFAAIGPAVGRFTEWELMRVAVSSRVEVYPHMARSSMFITRAPLAM